MEGNAAIGPGGGNGNSGGGTDTPSSTFGPPLAVAVATNASISVVKSLAISVPAAHQGWSSDCSNRAPVLSEILLLPLISLSGTHAGASAESSILASHGPGEFRLFKSSDL